MKALILAGGLIVGGAGAAFGQPTYKGPEVATPAKWVSTIVMHTADSARTAYAKTLQALLAAGYGIERSDKEGLYITTSTPGKPLPGNVFLTLRVAVTPVAGGAEVAFRGVYTWASTAAILAERQNRQVVVQFTGGGNNPTQRAWDGMQQVALATLPSARVGYK